MSDSTPPSSPSEDSAERLSRQLRETNFLLNQKIVQLETLYQAGLSLGASLQVEEIVGEFLLLAVAMVDARGGFLFLQDEKDGRFALVQHTGFEEAQLSLLSSGPLHERMQAALGEGARLYLGPDDLPDPVGSQHLLVVPVGKAGFFGVVDKETRQGVRAFSETDGHLLELACQQAGTALANARLYRRMVEEKNLNQSIVSSIANGVISTNLEGTIVRVNPTVERIFGEGIFFIGTSCSQLFERHGCSHLATAVRSSLEDGKERYVEAEPIPRGELSLNARISPLRDERDEVQGLVIALEDLTEQLRVRTLFKQYVSDPVVDVLLAADSPPALGGEKREATMLFADLVGWTELLHQIDAEEMVRLLNDCFTRLVDIVFDFHGTLDKYIGDSIMVVYGAPVSFADDTRRAALSALTIREEMARFNQDHQLSWGIKMGISQGTVTAGNVGSLRRMEYTVIGPSVSLAARLSDRARGGEILVDSRAYEELKDEFDWIPEGHQLFKGIRDPIAVYQLVGLPGTSSPQLDAEARSPLERSARIDLNIPLIPDMELTATQTAETVGHFMGLEEGKIEEVKMALIEACINAIEHSQSKDRRLQIVFDVSDATLTIVISDRGHGFDIETAQEKRRQRRESGQRQRGWGLQLMEELMDEVDIQSDPNGTTITLVKNR